MKKLLLGTAAFALAASLATSPASAQVKLDVGGYAKMYMTWLDQDEANDDPLTAADESGDVRAIDVQRDTEIHFTGETTLDNGLTVGFHTETEADGSDVAGSGDSFDVQESYAYFSGAWGRVNLGAEDGATYLLQVAAPSGDANIDGIRQWINPIRHTTLTDLAANSLTNDTYTIADLFSGTGTANAILSDVGAAGTTAGDVRSGAILDANAGLVTFSRRLDYAHDVSGYDNKLTYMTPVFNGFQAGVSYTPELTSGAGNGVDNGGAGNNLSDRAGDYGDSWELAARYEGQWDQLGIALGGGWSHAALEKNFDGGANGCNAAVFYTDNDASGTCTTGDGITKLEDNEAWNVGVDLNWAAFGLGAAYVENDNGLSGGNFDTQTWVVGVDYTTGPFKIGGSYLSENQDVGSADVDQDRWTAAVIYTYGPGMTFRGSVSYYDIDESIGNRAGNVNVNGDANATSVLLGTQIEF